MNRWLTLIPIGLAAVLASCGSSVTSSTQPATNGGVVDYYTMEVSPAQFAISAGDWASITATVDLSYENGASKPVSPQPTIKFYSSDPNVSISPAGQVCGGQWDSLYQNCNATGTLPLGYVTITARDITHNVSGTTQVSVHARATTVALTAAGYPTTNGCVSQNNLVTYTAAAYVPGVSGLIQIPSCSSNGVATGQYSAVGCVHDNDYTWTVSNSSAATVSQYGAVTAVSPGVTNVFANLNGTVSAPLAFASCPPKAIVISTSPYTGTTPTGPYSTSDLTVTSGSQEYVTATMLDINGNPITSAPLSFITSDPLTGSFTTFLPLTSTLSANSTGRVTFAASCNASTCNPTVGDFAPPNGTSISGASMGFGNPIYSNVIGATATGQTGSTVLVTGANFASSSLTNLAPAHELLVYDSESLALVNTIEIPNTPNSLVVAPNGNTAYVGSSEGLVVVNLTAYTSTIFTYPIAGALSTQQITGKVLGVSQDSRYVIVSDTSSSNPGNQEVFLIDTTGTKSATQFNLPYVTSVVFAADDSGFWLGANPPSGDATSYQGIYLYTSGAFVQEGSSNTASPSHHVTSLAWMPDGQSLFASGDELVNYSTCPRALTTTASSTVLLKTNPVSPSLPSSVAGGLATTAIGGIPQLIGLNGTTWFDYPLTTSAQIGANGSPSGSGNVCLSSVTVNAPATATSSLACTAQQVTFSPTLEQAFVTGVVTATPDNPSAPACGTPESVIHAYDVASDSEENNPTTSSPVIPLSGGILNDGRKLYFGTWDQSTQTATLHRVNLSTGQTVTNGTLTEVASPAEDLSTSVDVVPTFVAVVPK